jgi:hypothetical protein
MELTCNIQRLFHQKIWLPRCKLWKTCQQEQGINVKQLILEKRRNNRSRCQSIRQQKDNLHFIINVFDDDLDDQTNHTSPRDNMGRLILDRKDKLNWGRDLANNHADMYIRQGIYGNWYYRGNREFRFLLNNNKLSSAHETARAPPPRL